MTRYLSQSMRSRSDWDLPSGRREETRPNRSILRQSKTPSPRHKTSRGHDEYHEDYNHHRYDNGRLSGKTDNNHHYRDKDEERSSGGSDKSRSDKFVTSDKRSSRRQYGSDGEHDRNRRKHDTEWLSRTHDGTDRSRSRRLGSSRGGESWEIPVRDGDSDDSDSESKFQRSRSYHGKELHSSSRHLDADDRRKTSKDERRVKMYEQLHRRQTHGSGASNWLARDDEEDSDDQKSLSGTWSSSRVRNEYRSENASLRVPRLPPINQKIGAVSTPRGGVTSLPRPISRPRIGESLRNGSVADSKPRQLTRSRSDSLGSKKKNDGPKERSKRKSRTCAIL